MAQPWIVALFLDCENAGVNGWRPHHLGPLLQCPNATTVAQFKRAVSLGDIFFQAFPHNGCPESYDASLFEASLRIASRLAAQLGVPRPMTMSQRDETGMSRAILPLLNKHGIKYISLGSGGATGGHPVLPGSNATGPPAPGVPGNGGRGVFLWRDLVSGAEVIMTADHGYGGGLHTLPGSRVALYCAWNRDNSGPSPDIYTSVMANLRRDYPDADVHASTFDAFFAEAEKVRSQLPVLTQEIGDTWLYGLPSDPYKSAQFREISRRRAACIGDGRCDPEAADFVRFDLLLTQIPEHTWGLDTTFYLDDYLNWTNAQLEAAIDGPNYRLTIQSWLEQRSYIANAIANLAPGPFKTELEALIVSLTPPALEAARKARSAGYSVVPLPPERRSVGPFYCAKHNVTVEFAGSDGAISLLSFGARMLAGSGAGLGEVAYQTFSADNFSAFDADYGFTKCVTKNQSQNETPECHNFAKPNMSSAYGGNTARGYQVARPRLTGVRRSSDGCAFLVEAIFTAPLHAEAGAPARIVTSIAITADGVIQLNVSALNKTRTRLAEAMWVSLRPTVSSGARWRLRHGSGVELDPVDVVAHGATHLHALGSDGAVVAHDWAGPGSGTLILESLDVPVVSAGLLSPFPTPGGNSTADIAAWIRKGGWRYNVQNNIWNTNYPMWYPFVPADTEILARFQLSLA